MTLNASRLIVELRSLGGYAAGEAVGEGVGEASASFFVDFFVVLFLAGVGLVVASDVFLDVVCCELVEVDCLGTRGARRDKRDTEHRHYCGKEGFFHRYVANNRSLFIRCAQCKTFVESALGGRCGR